jgi:hypothetical protein
MMHRSSKRLLIETVMKRGKQRRKAIVDRLREEDNTIDSVFTIEDITDCTNNHDVSDQLITLSSNPTIILDDIDYNSFEDEYDVDITYHDEDVTYRVEIPRNLLRNIYTKYRNQNDSRTNRTNFKHREVSLLESPLERLIKMFDSFTVSSHKNTSTVSIEVL